MSFSLELTLPSAPLPAGGPVSLRLTLRNLSRTTASFARTSLYFDWHYALTLRRGNAPVGLTRYGEQGVRAAESGTAAAALDVVAPGALYTLDVPLHRIFDVSTAEAYSLIVSRAIVDPDSNGIVLAQSTPLAFELIG
jgi:hypothetical protein